VSSVYYEQLALDWSPENKENRQFNLIVFVVVCVILLVAIAISSVTVPDEPGVARSVVPERIANFIIEKKKPEPKKVTPEVKPKPIPKPKPKPKKTVKKLPKVKAQKPLTKTQKKAREKAAVSGLLALGNELADLMDTSDISAMVGGEVKSSSVSAATATGQNKTLLMADASKGSGGVNAVEYTAVVAGTQLTQREITQVKQSLLSPEVQAKSSGKQANKSRSAGVRAEEDITIVFDQNKSKLYSIYNRARRTNPNLKGKIVLEITISPAGKVTQIKVVSSELNDSKLESRLVNRIKFFNFGAKQVEQVIVTYPIEFLPS
jgi:TonB family protein